jgi:hypothetical protein
MAPTVGVLVSAAGLAAVHLIAGKLRLLHAVPRSRLLSVSGGVSVAYVFVHLLPEITERQAAMSPGGDSGGLLVPAASDRYLFVVGLAVLAGFYGLVLCAGGTGRAGGSEEVARGASTRTDVRVFWVHVGAFAAYNALIGYLLLHREEAGLANLLFYATAMAVHFVVNDYGLRDLHRDAYDRLARWMLSGAVLVGVLVGFLVGVPEGLLHLLFALLAGAVILNVIKEELPERRESRFWSFAAGAVGYSAVLLVST